MKKKIIWTFIILASLVADHYSFHYVSGSDTKTSTTDTVRTVIVVDTAKNVATDTEKKAVAKTQSVTVSK